MIYTNSLIYIKDNSGIKYVKTIKLLSNSKNIKIGDVIVTSIYERKKIDIKIKKKMFKQNINKALIITTRKSFKKKDGSFVKYDQTTGVMFNSEIKNLDIKDKKKKIKFKVFAPIIKELKYKNCNQILYFGKILY